MVFSALATFGITRAGAKDDTKVTKAEGKIHGESSEPTVPVLGSTDKLIARKDRLAQSAMITANLTAFLLVLLVQKHTGLTPLLAAMPVFIFLIAVEHVIQRVANFHSAAARYTVAGLICSVSAGVIQQISGVLFKKLFLTIGGVPYDILFSKYGTEFGGKAVQRGLALLFTDLGYYLSHRAEHQLQLGWMFHAIHHNNDQYNYAVALRQSWGSRLHSWAFYLPLAFFISHEDMRWAQEWNLMYQFWVHTCLVRKTHPLFEFIFSTPSHHRLHHDRRLHKNFGGIFIVWDRMFGTFVDETKLGKDQKHVGGDLTRLDDGEEVAVFGVMANQESYLLDLFQLQHPLTTIRSIYKAKTLRMKVKALVEGAGFYSAVHKDRGVVPRVSVPTKRRIRFQSTLPVLGSLYALIHFHVAVLFFITISVSPKLMSMSLLNVVISYGPVVACLSSLAFINDGHSWAPFIESARCLISYYTLSKAAPTGSQEYLSLFYLFSGMVALFNPHWLSAHKVVNSVKVKA